MQVGKERQRDTLLVLTLIRQSKGSASKINLIMHPSKLHLEPFISTTFNNLPLELNHSKSFTTFKSSLYINHVLAIPFLALFWFFCLLMKKFPEVCADNNIVEKRTQ